MKLDENISSCHRQRQRSRKTLLRGHVDGQITDLLPQTEIGFHFGKVHSILLYAVDVKGYLCDCLVALRFMNVK